MNNKFASRLFGELTVIVSLVAVFCFHAPVFAAEAAEEPAEAAPLVSFKSIWVNAGMLSYHFDRDKNFQGNNHGFGVEASLSDTNAIYGGNFINSVDKHSNYLGWAWRPWTLGPTRLGFIAGAFDGYPKVNNAGWFLAALPVLSYEYRYVGVNLLLIPEVSDKVDGAAVVQFKFRLK